jgi:D-serine deaminase-like pyridoxal phosphate-dependent protein
MSRGWFDSTLREALREQELPAAVVSLDAFDRNVERYAALARAAGKHVRIASKSLRVPELLRRAIDRSGGVFRGLLCFSAAEAALLVDRGFDDLVVAYPPGHLDDWRTVAALAASGKRIAAMVDSVEHVQMAAAAAGMRDRVTQVPIAIDVDVSYRALGLHLGARRSPLRDEASLRALVDAVAAEPRVRCVGMMGYEAQIAGVGDWNPFHPLRNWLVRCVRALSLPDVRRRRRTARALVEAKLGPLLFVNGGGTGSFREGLGESALTELTVGSGLLQSRLFDFYRGALAEPALAFALRVTRRPDPDIVTCHGGGFVASGAAGEDRLPLPFVPEGLRLIPGEGAGEVQTPVVGRSARNLKLGDVVLFRPAKAGEIAERFDRYLLWENGRLRSTPTYRGFGATLH